MCMCVIKPKIFSLANSKRVFVFVFVARVWREFWGQQEFCCRRRRRFKIHRVMMMMIACLNMAGNLKCEYIFSTYKSFIHCRDICNAENLIHKPCIWDSGLQKQPFNYVSWIILVCIWTVEFEDGFVLPTLFLAFGKWVRNISKNTPIT